MCERGQWHCVIMGLHGRGEVSPVAVVYTSNAHLLTKQCPSCACQKHSSHPILAARWTTLWQVAFRAISTSTTSRAACHLMHTLMKLELVGATAVSDFVQTFVSSIDFSGPSVLSDAATRLLTAVVENARQQNPAASVSTAEGALGWLFRNFLPSKLVQTFSQSVLTGCHRQLQRQALYFGSKSL